MYVEVVRDFKERGHVVALSQIPHLAEITDGELYKSMFSFGDDFKEYVENRGTVRGFDGIVMLGDEVILDLDGKDKKKAETVLDKIQMLGISKESVRIYFSGTGFHIALHPSLFQVEVSQNLDNEIAGIILENFPEADNVYDKTRIIRVANTINNKSGLYKIPLTYEEFVELSYEDITKLAKEPRFKFKDEWKPGMRILKYIPPEELSEGRNTESQLRTNKHICIHNILDGQPLEGERHNTILRLASHFHRQGYNQSVASAVIKDWLTDERERKDVDRVVNDIYKWNGFYSCKDPLLQKYCDKSCMFYTDTPIKDILDMEAEYINRLRGQTVSINLGDIFGVSQEYLIFGGELVSILGATGMGKTAFIQNIITRTNYPTLYFSLEMPAHQMYRRFIQVLTGKSKEDISSIVRTDYNKQLKHISLTSKSIYANEISKVIEAYSPKIIVIDHIGLMRSQYRDDYQKITEITGILKQICLEYDVIIFAISQVSREVARDAMNIGVHGGKGSGAIENDSDKVIVFTKANRMDTHARVYSVKDREGQIFETTMIMQNFKLDKRQKQF